MAFTEDVGKRYEDTVTSIAYNDGDNSDVSGLRTLIQQAKATTDKPTIIKVKTTIGKYATKQGTHGVHGTPIGDDDIARIRGAWVRPRSQVRRRCRCICSTKMLAPLARLHTRNGKRCGKATVHHTRTRPASWKDAGVENYLMVVRRIAGTT